MGRVTEPEVQRTTEELMVQEASQIDEPDFVDTRRRQTLRSGVVGPWGQSVQNRQRHAAR